MTKQEFCDQAMIAAMQASIIKGGSTSPQSIADYAWVYAKELTRIREEKNPTPEDIFR